MIQDTSNHQYKSITTSQVDELLAIYEDYLFIAREHERLLKLCSKEELALGQMEAMNPGAKDLGWQIVPLTPQEQQEYKDCINNDICNDSKKVFVILDHIKPEENSPFSKFFAIPPQTITSINMMMPSSIERCSFVFNKDEVLGGTEFFIDGLYKAIYTDTKNEDMPIKNFVYDNDTIENLCVIMNVADKFFKNGCVTDDKFEKMSVDVYAEAKIEVNENTILELLGAFAEKLQIICRDIYKPSKKEDELKKAQEDGLIHSYRDFYDYVNIRNLIRHQWDSLDDLVCFNMKQAEENKRTRQRNVKSYLKVFGQSSVQRAKSYIEILHQMQNVIYKIAPNRIIRNPLETNNKFFKRVKEISQQNPEMPLSVELNYALTDYKHEALNKNLNKILPWVNVIDDFSNRLAKQDNIDGYYTRSCFLQNFLTVECMVMRHCNLRGCEFEDTEKHRKNNQAWQYLRNTGILSHEESNKWQKYSALRNLLSHNYFDDKLRIQLQNQFDDFLNDVQKISDKFIEIGPDVRKTGDNIYEFAHIDGLGIELDIKNHKVLRKFRTTQQKETPQEFHFDGTEIKLFGDKIIGVKFSNGININLKQPHINLFDCVKLYKTDNLLYVLQTDKSKMFIDNNLRVVKYTEKNRNQPFYPGDNLLIDYRHSVLLDSGCRIKEIKIKDIKNNILRTTFGHTKEGGILISLPYEISVVQSSTGTSVMHNGMTLDVNNCQEFIKAYNTKQNILQQNLQNNIGR